MLVIKVKGLEFKAVVNTSAAAMVVKTSQLSAQTKQI
jgi:hypothetical protein